MNKTIEAFARKQILDGLKQLSPDYAQMFRLLYSPKDLHKSIEDVVAAMPAEKLDWALTQVENTLERVS